MKLILRIINNKRRIPMKTKLLNQLNDLVKQKTELEAEYNKLEKRQADILVSLHRLAGAEITINALLADISTEEKTSEVKGE